MTVPFATSEFGKAPAEGARVRLRDAPVGARGVIVEVQPERDELDHGVDAEELQRRLLEFGVVEGARIELIHEGGIGHDPIAVKLDDMRIALRRRDAGDVMIQLDV